MTALLNDQLCKPLCSAPPMAPCQISNPSAENWLKKINKSTNHIAYWCLFVTEFLKQTVWAFLVL